MEEKRSIFHWRIGVKMSDNRSEDSLLDAERVSVEEGYAIFWIAKKSQE